MVMRDFGAAHRKVRKERKGETQFGTRMTRIARIYTDTANPRASASTVAPVDVAHTYGSRHTWRSVFYHSFFLLNDEV